MGKSRVFFFVFFFPSQQLFIEFPIQSSTVNLGMKHLKGSEIYIYLHLSKKKSKRTSKVKRSEGQRLLDKRSVPHQSVHLGY